MKEKNQIYLYGLRDLMRPASRAVWQANFSPALDLRLGWEIWNQW